MKNDILKFAALGYHLWHPEADMSNVLKNAERYHRQHDEHPVKCQAGIDRHL